ncbi:Crp/Fnr family transcriptional regulator [Bradyrhizobium sp. 180]|uniref:Crp/Fnr family transcriptional regulator n=1 Tax=unclassified Bradyrhizobium TaxID=2631580 RepID=UPI001FF9B72D|nr:MULTISPECIES: Crp/Fnr family transcriptional regulator [unclassified Bradyrhizobium]MCK1422111.1 Crp/Fnr family transcriptional regulator [Bradyrhizobium sp. CW12]MCK1492737.1 Crp/Fnr family transcriptional regulator [Bradyrhizobium sp. 180]MCK1528862.1 Crp/Fnr family transcriptional regulator [Bradyrhizobium sp. 182]MCK1598057.1 Crp/Fnr family transcriptional regulator [Bradyrhizobium sp. 164]MCK1620079.1 Crp/Fnr family transcriptional regulator [Bradyrhizobium sp. 159]
MPGTLTAALVQKLSKANRLDQDDVLALEQLSIHSKRVAAQHRFVRDGDRPSESCLIVDGFAFRSKLTPDGQRQILSLHMPGEIPDLQSLHLHVMDHDLTTLTECTLGFIKHDTLRELNQRRPNVAAALWRETLIDSAIFREWIVNVGRRPARVRMAHLLVELYERLELIGRTTKGSFELPITQIELADCLGLSVVHVNRILQQLRHDGLVATERRTFHLLDKAKVEEVGQFEKIYLHQRPSV